MQKDYTDLSMARILSRFRVSASMGCLGGKSGRLEIEVGAAGSSIFGHGWRVRLIDHLKSSEKPGFPKSPVSGLKILRGYRLIN